MGFKVGLNCLHLPRMSETKKKIKEPGKKFSWIGENPRLLLLKVLSALVIYVFLIEPILFENLIRGDFYSFLEGHSIATRISYGLLILISCSFFGFIQGKMQRTFFNSFGSITLVIIVYAHLLSLSRYDLYPSGWCIKYLNLLFFIPVFSSVTFVCLFKKEKRIVEDDSDDSSSGIKLSQELPLTELAKAGQEIREHDFLGYYSLAEVVFEAITSLQPKIAFSIGINGSWGSGKSFLIDIITQDLVPKYNEKKDKITVIKFSPWLYPDEKSLVSNFFIKWKETLNESSLELEQEFEKYSALLTNVEIGLAGINTKLFSSYSKNLEQTKENIINFLKKTWCYLFDNN